MGFSLTRKVPAPKLPPVLIGSAVAQNAHSAVIRPIEGAEPTPAELAAAQRAIERREAVGIIIEPQFDAAWPRRIAAEAGVPVAVLDPIGDGDWLAMMQSNLAELLVLFNAPGQTADLLRLDLRLDEAAGQTPPEDPQP